MKIHGRHTMGVLLLALILFVGAFAGRAAELTAMEISSKLDALKETIVAEVTAALKTNAPKASYTTVWRDYEDAAIDALCIVLKKHVESLTDNNFDRGKSGKEKNRLADLTIVCSDQQIEISIKTARRSANPENDMGTFREHPSRQKLFVASFTLWVRYDDSGKGIRTDRVFFDRTWRFVGKSSLVDGVKYRKKDGNMRPKPWAMFDSGTSYWKTEEEFEAAVKRAEVYRANEVINEHLRELSDEDQRLLYERLKEKFGGAATHQ
jgi:hypothetical protein